MLKKDVLSYFSFFLTTANHISKRATKKMSASKNSKALPYSWSLCFLCILVVLRSLLETSNILWLVMDVSGCSSSMHLIPGCSQLENQHFWVLCNSPNVRILILQRIWLCCRYHSKNFPPFIKNSGVTNQLCILCKVFSKVFSIWLFPEGHTGVAMGVCLCRKGGSTHTFYVSPIFHLKKCWNEQVLWYFVSYLSLSNHLGLYKLMATSDAWR